MVVVIEGMICIGHSDKERGMVLEEGMNVEEEDVRMRKMVKELWKEESVKGSC